MEVNKLIQNYYKIRQTTSRVILILMILLISCKNGDENKNDEFLSEFLKTTPSLSGNDKMQYTSMYLFFSSLDDNTILICYSADLSRIYRELGISECDFKVFLRKLYVEEEKIDHSVLSHSVYTTFSINPEIQNSDITLLIDKYCVEYGVNQYGLYLNDDKDLKYNVLYKFFCNRYYIYIDDVAGEYRIEKK